MAAFSMSTLGRRQTYVVDDDPYWWDTNTGYIVKWCIFVALVVIFLLWFVGGYFHAKRRLKKGLMPLAYHRWLVPRRMLATVDPRYAYPQPTYMNYQQAPNGYPMYNMPPPVYDPTRPPVYDDSHGMSKVDPMQDRTERTRPNGEGTSAQEYAPPPGPPPAMR